MCFQNDELRSRNWKTPEKLFISAHFINGTNHEQTFLKKVVGFSRKFLKLSELDKSLKRILELHGSISNVNHASRLFDYFLAESRPSSGKKSIKFLVST